MTEGEWLKCRRAAKMLEFLGSQKEPQKATVFCCRLLFTDWSPCPGRCLTDFGDCGTE